MPFHAITPNPGVVRDPTSLASEGSWYDCDKIRFRSGWPETIGGWLKYASGSYLGISRYLHDWVTVSSSSYLAVGTTYKLYLNEGASMGDITSIRRTVTLGSAPLASTNASGVVTVTDSAHGAVVGDYVTFRSASTFGGLPIGELNVEHRINSVPTSSTYTILVATAASSSATGGGSSVVAAYQENVGLDTYVPSSGWGVGPWGSGPWGGTRSIDSSGQLRIWSMDSFGDDLLAAIRGGPVSYWDESVRPLERAKRLTEIARSTVSLATNPIATTNLSTTVTITDDLGHDLGVGDEVTISGASSTNGVPSAEINTTQTVTDTPTETTYSFSVTTAATSTGVGGGASVVANYVAGDYYAPISALSVLVSDQDKHAICFGTNPIGSTVIDPLMIRWSTSENVSVWRPTLENLAGGQRLSSGSVIMGAIRTRQEVLVWTDTGMHSMRYVGSPFVYSFSELATNVSLIAPSAWGSTGDSVYFMARGSFYVYSGSLRELPCPIEEYVFSDIDMSQRHKIVGGSNTDYNEIIWLYPSLADDTGEVSRYAIFNHESQIWYFGTLARGYWIDAPTKDLPLASTILGGSAGANPITSSNTTGTIVATYTAHGMAVGDTVIILGSSAVGGVPTTAINAQHTVTAVTDNTFTFVVADVATSTATGGGGAVVFRFPQYVYKHETGYSDDGRTMNAYIESADMDIDEGDSAWFIDRLIPDIKFKGSSGGTDEVTLSLKGRDYPGDTLTEIASESFGSTTPQKQIRARARQIRIRAETTASGFGWKLGKNRINAREDGRRT